MGGVLATVIRYTCFAPAFFKRSAITSAVEPVVVTSSTISTVFSLTNFLSLTLSVDNQIIHTSRCLGLYKVYGKTWASESDVPWFYRDYDDLSAQLLSDLDNDYTKIRNAIKTMFPNRNFKHMLDYLALERFSYQSTKFTINIWY